MILIVRGVYMRKVFDDDRGKRIYKIYSRVFNECPAWSWETETIDQCYNRLEKEIENAYIKEYNKLLRERKRSIKIANDEFNKKYEELKEKANSTNVLSDKLNEPYKIEFNNFFMKLDELNEKYGKK